MKALCAPLSATLLLAMLAAPTAFGGDLPEPKTNEGATSARVDGTRVTAEAWALALGHDVDAIVVTRLKTKDGKASKVETYERWSRDGKTKFERGSRALGKAWEKHLWAILAVDPKDRKLRKRKRRALLDRAMARLGPKGEREMDGYVVAWTLTKGVLENGAKPSRARVAIFTYTPSGRATTPPPSDDKKPGTVTPHGKAKKGAPPAKSGRGGPGSGFASGGGSGRVQVDSEKGVREHARVTVDLGCNLPKPAPKKPKPRSGPITPKKR